MIHDSERDSEEKETEEDAIEYEEKYGYRDSYGDLIRDEDGDVVINMGED